MTWWLDIAATAFGPEAGVQLKEIEIMNQGIPRTYTALEQQTLYAQGYAGSGAYTQGSALEQTEGEIEREFKRCVAATSAVREAIKLVYQRLLRVIPPATPAAQGKNGPSVVCNSELGADLAGLAEQAELAAQELREMAAAIQL